MDDGGSRCDKNQLYWRTKEKGTGLNVLRGLLNRLMHEMKCNMRYADDTTPCVTLKENVKKGK